MATRTCPECGAQYVASVRRCIDCEVVLVDQVPDGEAAATIAPSPVGDGDRVAYELEHWGNQLKVSLEGMLDKAGIRRVWEVGALVVSAADAEQVESLIETVEGRDVEHIHEMEEQLAFEIEGLDAEGAAELDARLIAAGIAHAWSEEGELLVALDDEDRVTAIVEAVVEGEIDDSVDGLAANQILSEIYVALDRLMKSPADHKLVNRLREAASALEPVGVPYGLAMDEWTGLKEQVADVVALAADDPDSDETDDDDGAATDQDGAATDQEADRDDGGSEASEQDADPEELDDPDSISRFESRAADLRERLLDWI